MQNPTSRLLFDRKHKASKTTTGSVEVCVTHSGKRLYVSTGVQVTTTQWSASSMRVVKHPDAGEFNNRIEASLRRVRKAINTLVEADEFSLENLRAALDDTPAVATGNPCDWFASQLAQADVAAGTRKQRETFIKVWRSLPYFSTWAGFTLANIGKYDKLARERTTKPAGLYNYHKHLRAALADAVRHKLIKRSPYDDYKITPPRQDTTAIRYLTAEERDRIAALNLTGTCAAVRDCFILCCYTGLAFSDMKKITPDDILRDGDRVYLRDKRVKTGTPYKLTLLPPARAILERYGWQMPVPSLVVYNSYLTVIQEMAQVTTHLSSHVARHTFATWALSSGVKIETVSKMLAHTNVNTTQIYAKVLQQDVDAGFDLLAGK